MFKFEYAMGVTGKISGASALQDLFHSSIAVNSSISTWEGQIKNGITNNVYFNYLREWKLQDNPLSFHISAGPTIAFGTKDIYIQNEMSVFVGKRNRMNASIAFDQISVTNNELFFSLVLAHRYVIHDTM